MYGKKSDGTNYPTGTKDYGEVLSNEYEDSNKSKYSIIDSKESIGKFEDNDDRIMDDKKSDGNNSPTGTKYDGGVSSNEDEDEDSIKSKSSIIDSKESINKCEYHYDWIVDDKKSDGTNSPTDTKDYGGVLSNEDEYSNKSKYSIIDSK